MPLKSSADSWASHSCTKPWDRNCQGAVDSYKSCIEDFVDEQQTAIRTHSDAASDAIEEWNSFANGY